MPVRKDSDDGYRGFRGATWKSGIVALAALAVVVIVMIERLAPKFDRDNLAPWGIWLLSLTILAIGLVRAAYEAIRLHHEWKALEMLQGDQSAIRARYPRTVVAIRLAAVQAAIEDRRVEREFRQSNRSLAAARLAGIGTITRFGSSALLVMAVLGTFAGMRNALPPLITAIATAAKAEQAPSGAFGSDGSGDIQTALTLVAEAFGSNFLALFGSLVLGLVAFGASLERRDLLTRLEVLSERRLYRQLPADADATELQKAVDELQRSVAAVADIGFAVDRLGTGIGDLRGVLRQTLSDMQSAFSTSIQQHAVRSQQQLNEAIGQLVGTLGTTSRALDATAVSYQGLVKGLEERDLGVRRAADVLAEHSRGLLVIEERSSATALQAAKATETAASTLARVSAIADVALPAFVRSADDISTALGTQAEQLVLAVSLLKVSGQHHGKSATSLEVMIAQLATMAAETPTLHRELHAELVKHIHDSLTRYALESKDASHALGMIVAQQVGKTTSAVSEASASHATASRELGQSFAAATEQIKLMSKEASSSQGALHSELVKNFRESLAQIGEEARESTHTLGMIFTRQADKTTVAVSEAAAATVGAVREAEQSAVGAIGGAVRATVNAVHESARATASVVDSLRAIEDERRLYLRSQEARPDTLPRPTG